MSNNRIPAQGPVRVGALLTTKLILSGDRNTAKLGLMNKMVVSSSVIFSSVSIFRKDPFGS